MIIILDFLRGVRKLRFLSSASLPPPFLLAFEIWGYRISRGWEEGNKASLEVS